MTNLINELKREHVFLVETLKRAKDLAITSEEGQSTLSTAKNALLAHLKKEDEQLYPVLKKAARKDTDLQTILNEFMQNAEVVSEEVLEFFHKYINGEESIEFAKDFARLYIILSRRIKKEEQVIYKKFDELVG